MKHINPLIDHLQDPKDNGDYELHMDGEKLREVLSAIDRIVESANGRRRASLGAVMLLEEIMDAHKLPRCDGWKGCDHYPCRVCTLAAKVVKELRQGL